MIDSAEFEKHVWDKVRQSKEYKDLLQKVEDYIMNNGAHMDDEFFASLKSAKPEFE